MDRRSALKQSALLALLGFVDVKALGAAPLPLLSARQSSTHKFTLGDLEIHILTDGHVVKKPVQPSFAPGYSQAEVREALETNFASVSELDLAMNILLVRYNKKLILIDTGCGHNFGGETGWLVQNLNDAGFQTSDITDIVLTHGHPDHIGGISDIGRNLIFKNAAVYIARKEYDYWMSTVPDFSKSKMASAEEKQALVDIAKNNLSTLGKNIRFFEDGDELLGCMKIIIAPGHTPGHALLQFYSQSEEMLHIVDLVHSDILSFENTRWGVDSDVDYDLAALSRHNILSQLAASRMLAFGYHLPWPGLGYVRTKGKSFEWIPKKHAIPG